MTGHSLKVTYLVALIVGLAAIGFYWDARTANETQTRVDRVVQRSDQDWCATLDLLTKVPVPKPTAPKQNPSRVGQYQLYLDFLSLKHRKGC